jgi:hypothetical protein
MVELPSALAGGSVISQIQGFSLMFLYSAKANITLSYFSPPAKAGGY